jgi:hypothetical protein
LVEWFDRVVERARIFDVETLRMAEFPPLLMPRLAGMGLAQGHGQIRPERERRVTMKKLLTATAIAGSLMLLGSAASAQWGGGPYRGGGGFGPGMMRGGGPGWMAGGGPCAGDTAPAAQITEEQAKERATAYADQYLKGFTVDRVLPFTGRFHTMYSVELKNDAGEVRTLRVNPFGNVMPFGGPWRRS